MTSTIVPPGRHGPQPFTDGRGFRLVGYPFLAALYSVLYVAANNSGEVVYWSDLLAPIAIALAVALLAILIGTVIAHDPTPGGWSRW